MPLEEGTANNKTKENVECYSFHIESIVSEWTVETDKLNYLVHLNESVQ